jgi:anthranilate phosphoribosyltransferase
MLHEALHKLVHHKADLTRDEARGVMDEILSGREGDPLIAAFLAGLAVKGESVEELVGFAQAIRARAVDLGIRVAEDISGTEREALVDTCGTGGDVSGTFNISTAVSFVVAGGGVRVAKHGNRSATSKCGSADVMEALGVRLDLPADRLAAALDEVGIVFLFAQAMHSAMKFAAPARRALRPLRTAFNLLGPLTNPAGASTQVVGVYEASVVEKLARALHELGSQSAFVVHGMDGLDEITTTTETLIAEVNASGVRTYRISPADFGVPSARVSDLAGSDSAEENAAIVRDVLAGSPGPRRDIVLVNASAAFVAAGRAQNWREGVAMAAQSIDSGAARGKLESLAAFSAV